MEIKYHPGFKKSWDKLFHWKYAPLRWWKEFIGIPREMQWKYQRMTRGWADSDVWGFHHYLSPILRDGLKELKENKMGHPGGLTEEAWNEKLQKMIDGFDAAVKLDNDEFMIWSGKEWVYNKMKEEEMRAAFNAGMDELKEYYFHLWD